MRFSYNSGLLIPVLLLHKQGIQKKRVNFHNIVEILLFKYLSLDSLKKVDSFINH